MTDVECGGVNEMVGIGCGIATIMMSSTPLWLANTGGSASDCAAAGCAPAQMATTAPATPIARRGMAPRTACLLNTCASLELLMCLSDGRHRGFSKLEVAARPRNMVEQ